MGALSPHVLWQSGQLDLQQAGERVTALSRAVEQRFRKAGERLASKPELRGVVEMLYDSLEEATATPKDR
jgi:hypothetical protein